MKDEKADIFCDYSTVQGINRAYLRSRALAVREVANSIGSLIGLLLAGLDNDESFRREVVFEDLEKMQFLATETNHCLNQSMTALLREYARYLKMFPKDGQETNDEE